MRALTWQGVGKVSVEDVPDPRIEAATDAIIRVTSTAICGSDLHLYKVLAPFLDPGDVIGHEAMGEVVEVGSAVERIKVGDRVVVPFVIACGTCEQCRRGMTSQCETTQHRDQGTGASLYGYTELYGSVAGGQAEYLRVLLADANAIKVGGELPDERYLFLSDILPTALQAVRYADLREGGVLGVIGLGPVGQLAASVAKHFGHRVIAVDPVDERRMMARKRGVEVLDVNDDTLDVMLDLTQGRGPDAVIDAVGMEADGDAAAAFAQSAVSVLPEPLAKRMARAAGVDRLAALQFAIKAVARGGTISVAGVYGGAADRLPMFTLFDKQLTMRMGQCNVHAHWPQLLPLVEDPADPLGVSTLVTHRGPLEHAPELFDLFARREGGCVKVVLTP